MKITSLQNSLVKSLANLKQKKYRDEKRLFLLEGIDLLNEAKKTNCIKQILYVDKPPFTNESIEFIEVTKEIIKKLSSQVTPGDFIAVCSFLDNASKLGNKVICLDGVQDPGNAGTILRSALAFGFDEMLLSNTSLDIYNDKFLRASKGSIFHMNIKRLDLKKELENRMNLNYQVITTAVSNCSKSYDEFKYEDKLCLVVGSEGQGISKEIFDLSRNSVHIPMSEMMESLNVGVAASIIMSKIFNK